LKLSECAGCTQGQWQVIPDTGSTPETAKLRGPYVIVLVLGTNRLPCVAERRLRRPVLVATGMHISARQDGAVPCMHI